MMRLFISEWDGQCDLASYNSWAQFIGSIWARDCNELSCSHL